MKTGLTAALGVVILIAIVSTSYSAGRSSRNEVTARQQGYGRGYAAGTLKGSLLGERRVTTARRGAYNRGYKAGGEFVLGYGFHYWAANAMYLVRIEDAVPGSRVPFRVAEALRMKRGTNYAICNDAPTFCEVRLSIPAANAATASGVIGPGNGYSVMCSDGSISNSGGLQGACSHHGGEAP